MFFFSLTLGAVRVDVADLRDRLFADDGCYDATLSSVVAELAEIDSLPCAEVQASVGDRNADADATEGAFGVCWHVVSAFKDVIIVWLVFLDETIENVFHVGPYVWVGVFVDAQRATGVLHKEVEKACLG